MSKYSDRIDKKESDTLGLELQGIVNQPVLVIGTAWVFSKSFNSLNNCSHLLFCEAEFLYITALSVLELALLIRLALNSLKSNPSASAS